MTILACAAAVMGALYAWRILPGLPYDEPSHWSVVNYLTAQHRLPILGRPGVTYEAQQPPLAYVLAAILSEAVRLVGGGNEAAFYAVRALGGLEIVLTVLVLVRLVARLTSDRGAALAALGYFAVAPIMVAIGWSVQNDALFMLLGFTALELALRWGRGMSLPRWFGLGLLVGLAMLTKLTAFPLLISLPIWLALGRAGARRWAASIAVFFAGAALVCGWWFVRNVDVYSKLFPTTELGGGPRFPAAGFHGFHTVTHLFENAVTYLWVPDEYYRNVIHMATLGKALIAAVTVAVVVVAALGSPRLIRELRGKQDLQAAADAWTLLVLTAAVSVVSWLATYVAVSAVAPRFAYMALPFWVGLIALAVATIKQRLSRMAGAVAVASPIVVALALGVWVLFAVSTVHSAPYQVHFSH